MPVHSVALGKVWWWAQNWAQEICLALSWFEQNRRIVGAIFPSRRSSAKTLAPSTGQLFDPAPRLRHSIMPGQHNALGRQGGKKGGR
jgi:hypothetical protein